MSALDVVLSLTVIASAIAVLWSAVLITRRDLCGLLGLDALTLVSGSTREISTGETGFFESFPEELPDPVDSCPNPGAPGRSAEVRDD